MTDMELVKWGDGSAFKPDERKALKFYAAGMIAVKKASTVDEAKNIKDVSRRVELYAKQKKDDTLIRQAMVIMTRAERQMGELLIQMGKNGERDPGHRKLNSKKEFNRPTLKDLGLSLKESMEAQRLAKIPENEFEERTSALLSTANLKEAKKEVQKIKQRVYNPRFVETDHSRDQGEGLLLIGAMEKIAHPDRPIVDCIRALPDSTRVRCNSLWSELQKNLSLIKKELSR